MTAPPFAPGWLLRHPQVQSVLASFKPRNWTRRAHRMAQAAQRHVLDCGAQVRLAGFHSAQAEGTKSRGLVVLIHGWEGSHDSVYLYSLACTLFDHGYNVFRLNLRDHGGTHDLNEEMFHSARLDEVLGAITAVERLDPVRPLFVVGFSLGGNFALRVGMRGAAQGVRPALSIGICPAISPGATLKALDHGPRLFHRYFINKWRRTMHAKAAAWPERYDFSDIWKLTSFTEITARFVERYTEYGELDRYLAEYTLTPAMLRQSAGPLAILTAQDDPVVPFSDFAGVADGARLRFLAPAHGGHCGFIENFRLHSWAEQRVLDLFAEARTASSA